MSRFPGVEIAHDRRVPMRDGAELAADLYLPAGGAPAPTLLLRTPYGRRTAEMEGYAHPTWYASRGFAVLVQDVRGRGDSDGDFAPFAHEGDDGYDTIEWAARQPWCNGRVGTYGFSYPGAVQLLAATRRPPHLAAMAPGMTASSFHEGWTYRGGALQLAFVLGWVAALGVDTALRAGDEAAAERFVSLLEAPEALYAQLPVARAFDPELERHVPYLRTWIEHRELDETWRSLSAEDLPHDVPCLHVGGWYDTFVTGTVATFVRLQADARAEQRLLIGPWLHMPWSQVVGISDFGGEARNLVDEEQLRFFRRHLAAGTTAAAVEPAAAAEAAPVRVFVMGARRWARFATWPPPADALRLHLRSGGRANSLNGDGELRDAPPDRDEAPDVFPADPRLPVRALGGRSCCAEEIAPMGRADQRPQESRNDVLVYTSGELEDDLTVVGAPRLVLAFASDAPSADVVVVLTDVAPCGCSVNVADANVRVDGADAGWRWLELELSPTAAVFERGHRIRLDVMGSSFPLLDRNPHTGAGPEARLGELRVATHVVYHDRERASRLELPVVEP